MVYWLEVELILSKWVGLSMFEVWGKKIAGPPQGLLQVRTTLIRTSGKQVP